MRENTSSSKGAIFDPLFQGLSIFSEYSPNFQKVSFG